MKSFFLMATAVVWAAMGSVPAVAQDGGGEVEGEVTAVEAPDSGSPEFWSKLQIHGYLTQAYAQSDGLGVFGATEEGTTDYRTVALQVSYDYDPSSRFVLQLAHQRIGARDMFADDIQLDWAFYQKRFRSGTVLRVGRVLTPVGLVNDIRDVGMLLPFFRVPETFYGETSFSLETIDGVTLGHTFDLAPDWRLDTIAFFGGWDTVDPGPDTEGRAEDGAGLTLILETPVEGLRFALGSLSFLAREGTVRPPGSQERRRFDWGAVELVRGRFSLLAETFNFVRRDVSDERAWYVQASFSATEKLSVHGQFEHADIDLLAAPFGRFDFVDDAALGLSYRHNDNAVLKGEYHVAERRNADGVSFTPSGIDGDADVDYFIASFSVGF